MLFLFPKSFISVNKFQCQKEHQTTCHHHSFQILDFHPYSLFLLILLINYFKPEFIHLSNQLMSVGMSLFYFKHLLEDFMAFIDQV